MPSYFYKCIECNKEFEAVTKWDENASCPDCNVQCDRIWGKGSFGIAGCPNTKG